MNIPLRIMVSGIFAAVFMFSGFTAFGAPSVDDCGGVKCSSGKFCSQVHVGPGKSKWECTSTQVGFRSPAGTTVTTNTPLFNFIKSLVGFNKPSSAPAFVLVKPASMPQGAFDHYTKLSPCNNDRSSAGNSSNGSGSNGWNTAIVCIENPHYDANGNFLCDKWSDGRL